MQKKTKKTIIQQHTKLKRKKKEVIHILKNKNMNITKKTEIGSKLLHSHTIK